MPGETGQTIADFGLGFTGWLSLLPIFAAGINVLTQPFGGDTGFFLKVLAGLLRQW